MFGLMQDPQAPGRVHRVVVATAADGTRWAAWPGGIAWAEAADADAPRAAAGAGEISAQSGQVLAPCAGTLVGLDVAPGDRVTAGAKVATLEAMKMEFALVAAVTGTVCAVPAAIGAVVQKGAVVVEVAFAPEGQ